MRIAVGCGSRGIKNYLAIAKATVDALKELGAKPFVVAAMGSHGGATPEGQRELLASYDIDEAHLGVPVVTDMDAVADRHELAGASRSGGTRTRSPPTASSRCRA